jgi:hypothetical protein
MIDNFSVSEERFATFICSESYKKILTYDNQIAPKNWMHLPVKKKNIKSNDSSKDIYHLR